MSCFANRPSTTLTSLRLNHDFGIRATPLNQLLRPRQLVYNIWGFKTKMEDNGKRTYGAKQISEFWEKSVRLSANQMFMAKTGTIDTCLTICKRLFSIPEAEKILAESEARYGTDGPWSSIWVLQELISRCQTKLKIVSFHVFEKYSPNVIFLQTLPRRALHSTSAIIFRYATIRDTLNGVGCPCG